MADNTEMKITPDKTPNQAAVAAAARLLNSARKSQTKKLAKKMKLSLRKLQCVADKDSRATLVLFPDSSDNDGIEFRETVSLISAAGPLPVTGKRKKTSPAEKTYRNKNMKRENNEINVSNTAETSGSSPVYFTRSPGENDQMSMNLYLRENTCSDACGEYNASKGWCPTCNRESNSGTDNSIKSVIECGENIKSENGVAEKLLLSAFGNVLPQGKFVHLIDMCLKERLEQKDSASEDSEHVSKVSSQPAEKEKSWNKSGENEALPLEYFLCQLCQKDLSHMNSQRRTIHINNCMDQEEKKMEEAEERQRALQAARNQVLDCPLCGIGLRTESSRKTHLKKCATRLGVEADQLLAAVKRQTGEHQTALAAGILPTSCRPGRRIRQNPVVSRKGLATVPKSKLEEDTQLALAISSSLQADSLDAGPNSSGDTITVPVKRGRRNKHQEGCLLLDLTEAQAQSRIESRVSAFIMLQEEDSNTEDDLHLPEVDRKVLQTGPAHSTQWSADSAGISSKMFWRLTALKDECSIPSEVLSDSSLAFYVPALMPPLQMSTVKVGSKFRKMSEIPGRQGSQETVGEIEHTCGQGEIAEECRLPPSTQTAAVLADLAAEADGIEDEQQSLFSSPVKPNFQEETLQDLQSAFSSLVNQQKFSDIVILTSDATTLYAHQVILSARCPSLLRILDTGVGLTAYSSPCVLAVLKFLYAGITEVDQRWISEIIDLAQSLRLPKLVEICRYQHQADFTPKYLSNTSMDREDDKASSSISVSSFDFNCEAERKENLKGKDCLGSGSEEASIPLEQNESVLKLTQNLEKDKGSTSDSKQHQCQPAVVLVKTNDRKPSSSKISKTSVEEKDSSCDENAASTEVPLLEDNDLCTVKCTESSPKVDLKDERFFAKFEKELSEKVDVASNKSIVMEQLSSSPLDTDKGFQVEEVLGDVSFEEDEIRLLVLQREELEDEVNSKSPVTNEVDSSRRGKSLQANKMTDTKQQQDLTCSFSDDDLFSGDDFEIPFVHGSPQLSASQICSSEQKLKTKRTAGIDSMIQNDSRQTASDSPTTYKSLSAHIGPGDKDIEIGENLPKSHLSFPSQKQRTAGLEKKFSGCSLSAVETSYGQSSLSSPNNIHLKTSTPQSSDPSRQKVATASKSRMVHTGFEVATFTSESCVESRILDDSGPSKSPGVVRTSRALHTPGLPVVEQDSLYVTPRVDQSEMRRTFQLVTPLPQQTGDDSFSETRLCHLVARNRPQAEELSSTGIKVQPSAGDCKAYSIRELTNTKKTYIHVNAGWKCAELSIDSDDSDLEIIDTSFPDAPSPQFVAPAKQNFSQSQQMSKPIGNISHSQPVSESASNISQSQPRSKSASNISHSQPVSKSASNISHSQPVSKSANNISYSQPESKYPSVFEPYLSADMTSLGKDVSFCQTQRIGALSPSSKITSTNFKSDRKLLSNNTSSTPLASCTKTPTKFSLNSEETWPKTVLVAADISLGYSTGGRKLSSKESVVLSPKQKMVLSPNQNVHSVPSSEKSATPQKLQSSKSSPVVAIAVDKEHNEKSEKTCHLSSSLSPEGFVSDENELANSSYLWREENMPLEEWSQEERNLMPSQEDKHVIKSQLSSKPVVTKVTKKRGKSAWVPPSPFTPMPTYDAMTTPDLKNEMKKYGLKAVGKKRMKLVLRDLYSKTHQYETDSNCELDNRDAAGVSGQQEAKLCQQTLRKGASDQPNSKLSQRQTHFPLLPEDSGPKRQMKKKVTQQKQTDFESQPRKKKRPKTKRGLANDMKDDKVLNTVDAEASKRSMCGQRMEPNNGKELFSLALHQSPQKQRDENRKDDAGTFVTFVSPTKSASDYSSSSERDKISSSQDSDASQQPDVSVLEELGEDSEDEDAISASQQANHDLPQRLMVFFQTHPVLYNKILTYEPLDLALLKEEMRAAGIQCSQKKLHSFLNEKTTSSSQEATLEKEESDAFTK